MHAIRIISLVSFLACGRGLGGQPDTNATTGSISTSEMATRLWINSFQPVTVTTDHRQGVGRPSTPAIPEPVVLEWRTNYAFFSRQLLSPAENAHLDSDSLKRILFDAWEKEKSCAMLPVEATSTRFKDEPVWVVEFRWEYKRAVGHGYMGHLSRHTINRNTLKLITVEQCG